MSPQLPQQQQASREVYGDPPAAAVFLRPGLHVPRPPARRNQRVPLEPQEEPSVFSCKARSWMIAPATPGTKRASKLTCHQGEGLQGCVQQALSRLVQGN
ncbi:hypothetical protein ILYODFUR_031972 [Ilyodon furcidens]|uniref:Uncharacterized protein n=1 Tax=Ilyodon furcidens TaxID=33524 RepID=A0ABV0UBW8_9TELE